MTETMLRTSAEKSALRHKTLHPKAINKTKTVYCHINPNLYGGGGANLAPRQFFATAQKRLALDC